MMLLAALLSLPSIGFSVEPDPFHLSPASHATSDDRESLEDMLGRLGVKRAAVLAKLQEQLTPLLKDLTEEIENRSSKRITRVRERIAELGPAVAPLLVTNLDPGLKPERPASEFSRQLSLTLVLIPTSAITDTLLVLSETGSPAAMSNALRVLAVSPEPARVSPRLIKLYEQSEGGAKARYLETIAQLGEQQADQILHDVLMGKDALLRGIALDAVISAGAEQFASEILLLLRDLDTSAEFAYKFVAYFRNCPDIVDKEHVAALLNAATDGRVKADQRIAILGQLRTWEHLISSRMKRSLKNLKTPANRKVEQQAKILLAVLGDGSARRELLSPYDDEVDKKGDWTGPFVSRGMILYEINEFSRALRDFKQAIKLSRDEPRSVPEAYEFAARCSARMGKLKRAAEYLQKSPIDLKQLRALGSDPVFRELRESRYGDVFRLE